MTWQDRCLREDDGRKLDHQTLEVLRIRAVEQVVAGGHPEDVARVQHGRQDGSARSPASNSPVGSSCAVRVMRSRNAIGLGLPLTISGDPRHVQPRRTMRTRLPAEYWLAAAARANTPRLSAGRLGFRGELGGELNDQRAAAARGITNSGGRPW